MNKMLHSYYFARNIAFKTKKEEIENSNDNPHLLECRFLNLDFGRQTGKSYFIYKKALELSDKHKVGIIVRNNERKLRILKEKPELKNSNVVLISQYAPCNLRVCYFDYLFVEDSSYIGYDKSEEICKIIAPMTNLKIIALC